MTWTCAAIDHGVAIFPDGKIGPCCQIDAGYLKSISELSNPNRFVDLKTRDCPPDHPCSKCSVAEYQGLTSYRSTFNNLVTKKSGLQFVDIRNTNLCNLKCRYCGPHFSNQWAKELDQPITLQHHSIDKYRDILFTESLHWMYFTGGEPLINGEHWQILEELISSGRSANIKLEYNTNLTTLKFKDKNIFDIWKKFESITIRCSIDAVGKPLEYIRSGSNWDIIENNLLEILKFRDEKMSISLSPVISILNIWFVDQLFEFACRYKIPLRPIILSGPDYLSLDVVPDSLKNLIQTKIQNFKQYNIDTKIIDRMLDLTANNINSHLFQHTLNHIMLLDNIRDEKLFDLLPFKMISKNTILKNYEYQ